MLDEDALYDEWVTRRSHLTWAEFKARIYAFERRRQEEERAEEEARMRLLAQQHEEELKRREAWEIRNERRLRTFRKNRALRELRLPEIDRELETERRQTGPAQIGIADAYRMLTDDNQRFEIAWEDIRYSVGELAS